MQDVSQTEVAEAMHAHAAEPSMSGVRTAAALLEVAETIQAIGDAVEIARRAAREVTLLVGADSAIYFSFDESRQHVVAVAGYRIPEALRHPEYRVERAELPFALREANRRGQPVASPGFAEDGRFDSPMVRGLPIQPRSVLCAPAITEGISCGALVACWWREAHEPTPEEIRIATAISGLVAVALEQRRRRISMSAAGVAIAAPNKTLFIVARHNRHLFDALRRTFAGDASVEIVLDRRSIQRRHEEQPPPPADRRELDRRQLAEVESQLRRRGWAVVTVRPRG